MPKKKKENLTKALSRAQKRANLVKDLNKAFGPNTLVQLGKLGEERLRIRSIPTGSMELDLALGCGGWPRGRVSEVYGPNSGGKTTLIGQAIREAQKMGDLAFYMDAEHKLNPEYFVKLGVNLDDLDFHQPKSAESALEILDEAIDSGIYGIVALDSIAMMSPESELEGEYVARDMAGMERAQLLSKHFRRIKHRINNLTTAYLCVNQVRDTPGMGQVQPGGNGLKFAAAVRVNVSQWWKDSKWVGIRSNIVKNQVGGRPYAKTEMPWAEEHDTGLDFGASVVRAATEMNVLHANGSHYYWDFGKAGDGSEMERIAQGWASCAKFFEDHPEHMETLIQQADAQMGWVR